MIRCASTRQSAASLVSRRFFGLRAPDFPSIDVRQLEATAAPDVRRAALDALRSALKQRGFFYATNVPQLPRSYIDSVYEYLARAHALPVEVKRRFVSPYGGYVGSDAGAEFAELAYAAGTTASVRAWDFSRAPFTAAASIAPSSDQKAPRRRFPNVADDGLAPDFETKMNELYDRQNQLAAVLLPAFAEMFGERADLFSRFFDAGDLGTIRLLSYPGLAPVANAATQSTGTDFGIAPHTDFEVFTLMHQNAPGLQFMLPPSEQVAAAVSAGTSAKAAPLTWLDAPVDDGNFVVIVGDVLVRCTLCSCRRRGIDESCQLAPKALTFVLLGMGSLLWHSFAHRSA